MYLGLPLDVVEIAEPVSRMCWSISLWLLLIHWFPQAKRGVLQTCNMQLFLSCRLHVWSPPMSIYDLSLIFYRSMTGRIFFCQIFRQHCQQHSATGDESTPGSWPLRPEKTTESLKTQPWGRIGSDTMECLHDTQLMTAIVCGMYSHSYGLSDLCKLCVRCVKDTADSDSLSIVFCVSLADESPCDAKPEWRILTSTSCLNVVFIKVDRRCKWSFVIYRRAGQTTRSRR